MSVFRYVGIPLEGGALRRGEAVGETPAQVRAALRRVGLQVLELHPERRPMPLLPARFPSLDRMRRSRRSAQKAELFDALSTLLACGGALDAALESQLSGQGGREASARRAFVLELREAIRAGRSLHEAAAQHPGWCSPQEVAILESAQRTGTLAAALASLAQRCEQEESTQARIAGALAYPAVVAVLAAGAFLFLSNHTLPQLTAILEEAKIEVPPLTAAVIAAGRAALRWGWMVLPAIGALLLGAPWLRRRLAASERPSLAALGRWTPRFARRRALAQWASGMAHLLGAGVPAVEALSVLAPTVSSAALGEGLTAAARRVERGEPLSLALSKAASLDPEIATLLEVGERSGELPTLLERLAARLERSSRRELERWTALLEPAAIVLLAIAIGIVVMAAAAAMVSLQKVLA